MFGYPGSETVPRTATARPGTRAAQPAFRRWKRADRHSTREPHPALTKDGDLPRHQGIGLEEQHRPGDPRSAGLANRFKRPQLHHPVMRAERNLLVKMQDITRKPPRPRHVEPPPACESQRWVVLTSWGGTGSIAGTVPELAIWAKIGRAYELTQSRGLSESRESSGESESR